MKNIFLLLTLACLPVILLSQVKDQPVYSLKKLLLEEYNRKKEILPFVIKS